MMSSAPSPITGQVELYENERRWVGGGFSKKGLFPTERHPFSTEDGSISYRTLEQAGEALLGKGWVWEAGSEYTYEVPSRLNEECDCDEDGWRYSVDFSPGSLPSSRPGMAHFVRRRRIIRRKVFDPQTIASYNKCEYCDSEAVDSLSSKILEALAVATLLQRDAQHTLTDAIALGLKEKLIDSLGIDDEMPDWSQKVDPSTRLQNLQEELGRFGFKNKNVLTAMFQADGLPKGLTERRELVSTRYFGTEERDAFACIVIRHLDPECVLHCGRESCSEECEFFRVNCPNERCDKTVSCKYLEWHINKVCPHTVISCPNDCGDSFPRNRREVHLADACGLRSTRCPFYALGCDAMVPAKDRAEHVQEHANGHLMLAARRIEEYGIRMNEMSKRIEHLERENVALKTNVAASAGKYDKDVSAVDKQVKQVSKKLTTLEKRCNSEFRSHNK
jgi:hypothetical protein